MGFGIAPDGRPFASYGSDHEHTSVPVGHLVIEPQVWHTLKIRMQLVYGTTSSTAGFYMLFCVDRYNQGPEIFIPWQNPNDTDIQYLRVGPIGSNTYMSDIIIHRGMINESNRIATQYFRSTGGPDSECGPAGTIDTSTHEGTFPIELYGNVCLGTLQVSVSNPAARTWTGDFPDEAWSGTPQDLADLAAQGLIPPGFMYGSFWKSVAFKSLEVYCLYIATAYLQTGPDGTPLSGRYIHSTCSAFMVDGDSNMLPAGPGCLLDITQLCHIHEINRAMWTAAILTGGDIHWGFKGMGRPGWFVIEE